MSQFTLTPFSQTSSYGSRKRKSVYSQGPRRKMFRSPAIPRPRMRAAIDAAIRRQRETKFVTYVENELALSSLSATGYVRLFPLPAVGAGSHQRIGNKIDVVGIKAAVVLHNNNISDFCAVRVLLLEVFDGNQSTTAIANGAFEGASGGDLGISGLLYDMIKKTNREQVRVIRDQLFTLNGSNQGEKLQVFKHYAKINQQMVFQDNLASVPVNSHYALLLLNLEGDGDESLGSTVDASIIMDMYYKD